MTIDEAIQRLRDTLRQADPNWHARSMLEALLDEHERMRARLMELERLSGALPDPIEYEDSEK